ncbi:hypothetical protein ACKURH_08890 [Enterobacter soli]|uniref:hypothetical protein n=1 Tax=Enterobacter soli TaxID=885040 RepID=UPI0023788822|nr:hypothetical protein [Enterobacter soli]MDD9245216.1 hypothetical protein [Enterobacter soli]
MWYLYSAELNLFYPLDLKKDYGSYWPKTGKFVNDTVYQEFSANSPPEGKMRVAGADGLPAWADIPVSVSE